MEQQHTIAVVGLGYVGLPLAAALANSYEVHGFDIDSKRVKELRLGNDFTGEVDPKVLQNDRLSFHDTPDILGECDVVIVAVPTPITEAKQPDLRPLLRATETVGKHMQSGTIVSFESTVFPGVTEELCAPLLTKESGLTYKKDFTVAYSPERVNPGDTEHTIDKIVKVVSACTNESLETIAEIYGAITSAGVFRASSIRVAESAKVIENIQRDINIALMNELQVIFDKMDINIHDILEAARTKWNFLPFHPGLVGGHCIGVDPYYLAHKAEMIGIRPEIILAGRRMNDSMAGYHAGAVIKKMIEKGIPVHGACLLVLGATFKPDVPDMRNSKVQDFIQELRSYGCDVHLCEPNYESGREIFGCVNLAWKPGTEKDFGFVVRAVNHSVFTEATVDYAIGADSPEQAARESEQSRTMRSTLQKVERAKIARHRS